MKIELALVGVVERLADPARQMDIGRGDLDFLTLVLYRHDPMQSARTFLQLLLVER